MRTERAKGYITAIQARIDELVKARNARIVAGKPFADLNAEIDRLRMKLIAYMGALQSISDCMQAMDKRGVSAAEREGFQAEIDRAQVTVGSIESWADATVMHYRKEAS